MYKPLRLAIALLALVAGSAARADEPVRLRLKDGSGPIEVRLVRWDFESRQLTVALADGSQREISPAELADADRRAINKMLQRQLNERDLPAGIPPGPAGSLIPSPPTGSGKADNVELHGISWLADRDAALQLARGDEPAADDRPVLWFRVLGNLSGFM